MKRALITGIAGQDGSYLAELLLEKGYEVFGLVRGLSAENNWRIKHLLDKIHIIYGDITDRASLINAIEVSKPDEVYNLAGQSFVKTSWEQPILTKEINDLGTEKLLSAIRAIKPDARIYQASSSAMFGKSNVGGIQDEGVGFHPTNPYAISKLSAHWTAVNYRESYDMFICCGIMFNHESPRRGVEAVARKIADGVARIKLGLSDEICLGNLDAKRDFGYAKDYVEAMWMMLQQDEPEDFVIATGELHSIKDFLGAAFGVVGISDWEKYVKQDERYMRPVDVLSIKGNPKKINEKLGWKPKVSFEELVKIMVEEDIKRLKKKIN